MVELSEKYNCGCVFVRYMWVQLAPISHRNKLIELTLTADSFQSQTVIFPVRNISTNIPIYLYKVIFFS